jgi:maltose operon protein
MSKPALALLASAALAGCGTVIDFGPEPGTIGDESYLQFQPELHGPNAPPREPPVDSIRLGGNREDAAVSGPAMAQPQAQSEAELQGQPQLQPQVATPVLPPPPPAPAIPAAPTSEALFNDAIRRAVDSGDIDRALKLLEEAERLGSQSARPTFIEAIQSRGN